MIQLSKAAVHEVLRLQRKFSQPNPLFRLGVQSSGCSGMSYTMSFDTTVQPGDQLYTCDSVQIVVDQQSLAYLEGLRLDYSEDLMGGGFRFHNPNATETCGCGNSFAVGSLS